ncbi:bacterioferritin [Neptunicella marina]|uniref:Bacterioferritin n=1 Tax=Neptunicella marina TaxID=2125989 RepID=A0A8J6IXT7_9ALTE|nr:bacterioferritin [Neptunicella marina]MBC3767223.1 bacterioferritin [Neptunicella marina]
MKGQQSIIDHMNTLLGAELAAMDQYFIHAKMYEDWGLNKLHERIAHEFDDEKGHASLLIERILMLEGTPDMSSRSAVRIGKTVPEMLENDLLLEQEVGDALKAAIQECEKSQDYVTREMLETLLDDTERDHAHWLEQQLGLIKLTGLANYLQSQL